MKKLIIVGGRGNGTVVASTVEDINANKAEWEIIGFLNDRETEPLNCYPILGSISPEVVSKYLQDPNVFFYWSLVSTKLREKFTHRLFELQIPENRFATLVHPTSVVSKFAKLGCGVCVQPLVNIGPNVTIENHVHIFAQGMVGHDAYLKNFSYVANNASVGAEVVLEEGAYLGTNATVREHVVLGAWSITGMGSVVLKDVPAGATVVGNPAKILSPKK